MWHDHSHFKDGLSSVGWGLVYIQPTYQIWSLCSYLLRRKAMQNVEIVGVWVVMGHPRSSLCCNSIEHMFNFNRNYASIFYDFWVIASYLSKALLLTYPTCIWCLHWGQTPVESCRDFRCQKSRVVWCCLCDAVFGRFSRQPICDRRTDRQTHDGS